jgi:membrane-bound ClpP family serine protease
VDVVADGAFIDAGTEVEVVDISSNRIMVSAVDEKGDSASTN